MADRTKIIDLRGDPEFTYSGEFLRRALVSKINLLEQSIVKKLEKLSVMLPDSDMRLDLLVLFGGDIKKLNPEAQIIHSLCVRICEDRQEISDLSDLANNIASGSTTMYVVSKDQIHKFGINLISRG